jgi:hypothetical protein
MFSVYISLLLPHLLNADLASDVPLISQKKEMISTSSYATKWYITLFSTTLPFHSQLRIWDAFFLEGQDLLIVVSVGILWAFRGESRLSFPPSSMSTSTPLSLWNHTCLAYSLTLFLFLLLRCLFDLPDHLGSSEASFETILSLLSSFFIPEDDDAFMAWVQATLALKGLQGKMDEWRSEWKGFVREGTEMQKLM